MPFVGRKRLKVSQLLGIEIIMLRDDPKLETYRDNCWLSFVSMENFLLHLLPSFSVPRLLLESLNS